MTNEKGGGSGQRLHRYSQLAKGNVLSLVEETAGNLAKAWVSDR